MLKNTVSGGTQWEGSFIHDAVIIFELGFVPLKGVEFKTISEETGWQGQREKDWEKGRLEGVCLGLHQQMLDINQIRTYLFGCLAEVLDWNILATGLVGSAIWLFPRSLVGPGREMRVLF